MKIYRQHFFSRERVEYSVEEAVTASCDGDDYDTGSVEAARKTADNAAKAVGVLAQALFNRDLLDKDEIESLVGYKFTVEE